MELLRGTRKNTESEVALRVTDISVIHYYTHCAHTTNPKPSLMSIRDEARALVAKLHLEKKRERKIPFAIHARNETKGENFFSRFVESCFALVKAAAASYTFFASLFFSQFPLKEQCNAGKARYMVSSASTCMGILLP